MVRHNNMIPNGHFHKKWQKHIKMWFNQPMKKIRRKNFRARKLIRAAPKPVQLFRPVVYCPTVRYNSKMRPGRGFTLLELKQAGINRKFASTIGIAVDHRRRNRCLESIQRNVQKLKEYQGRLILYPVKKKEVIVTDDGKTLNKMVRKAPVKVSGKIPTEEEKKFEAYITLRRARCDAKYMGVRAKKKISKSEGTEGVKAFS